MGLYSSQQEQSKMLSKATSCCMQHTGKWCHGDTTPYLGLWSKLFGKGSY